MLPSQSGEMTGTVGLNRRAVCIYGQGLVEGEEPAPGSRQTRLSRVQLAELLQVTASASVGNAATFHEDQDRS
jgi:hypothetical protein